MIGSTAIRVDQLTKRDRTRTRIDSLTFDVPAGEVVGLLGPNGCGKTTAMKMLVGLVSPTSGRAEVLGCRVGSKEFPVALRKVGALIESPALYGQLTVRENLELESVARSSPISRAEMGDLLTEVGLSERADQRASTLSLGLKQRLGIALAVVTKPELVLLDEPANGLDPAGIVETRQFLRRLAGRGTTVLVSSHQLSEAQQTCDRIVVMSAGRVVTAGLTAEILRRFSGNRFVARLQPGEVSVAQSCLNLTRWEWEADGSDASITVTLPDQLGGADLNRALSAHGIHAIEIIEARVTLEEAFLKLTRTEKEHADAAC